MLIALGVSGGIAAYKAAEIARGLIKAGADVQPILTDNAERFVTPLTLQTLTQRPVLTQTFDLDQTKTVQHIELAREVDALVVAPATANVLAKFARGIADDLLSTFFISVTCPIVLAPAMNTRMWLNDATQESLSALRKRGVRIVDPEAGWLAEREEGVGRLADPATIVEATLEVARRSTSLVGRTVVVSAGPTREPIDPVRFLTNRSSGKMGFALAEAAARRGATVHLVSGVVSLPTPFGVTRHDVETSAQLREKMLELRNGADAIFMAAAVSDYLPRTSEQKIKKSGASLTLTLDEGPDILAELGASRGDEVLVGFAAETQDLLNNAQAKLKKKGADFIVANDVSTKEIGFESNDNAVTILDADGGKRTIDRASKREVAEKILDHCLARVAAGS